jgi:general secretion pathway protein A
MLDLAELRIDLGPWEPNDLNAYLKSALTHAGREGSLFAESAVARLHELTQGIPRRVNQLAELALLAADGRGIGEIDAAMLDSICEELGTIEVGSGEEK